MGEVLVVEDVRLRYGHQPYVLDGVDLTIDAGECVSLHGANGAGKSTLLRIIAALELRYEGCVLVAGLRPHAARERVAYTPPFELVWNTMTATSQLKQVLNVAGLRAPWPPAAELAMAIASDFGQLRGRWLSSGQRRLLTVASALLLPADLVLLDEPLNSLDGDRSGLVIEAIESATEHGAAVLVASHDAIAPSTRAVALDNGRVVSTA